MSLFSNVTPYKSAMPLNLNIVTDDDYKEKQNDLIIVMIKN